MTKFRKFIYLSLALHLLLAAVFYRVPLGKEQEEEEYYTVRLAEPPAPGAPEEPLESPAARQPEPSQPSRQPPPPPVVKEKPPEVVPEKLEGPERAGTPEGEPEGELKAEGRAEKETGEPGGPEDKTGTGPQAPEATAEGHGLAPGGALSNALEPGGAERGRLFDRDIIAKLSRKPESSAREGITFDTTEFKYYSYMRRLKEKIESIWMYPPSAVSRGIYGDLYIRFVIKKNGKLGELEVVRTSGIRMLDEAAVRALKDADPYWPLPEDWGEDELIITGHFIYSLYGIYVR